MSDYVPSRKIVSIIDNYILVDDFCETKRKDNLEDLENFVYDKGLGLFESQKRYTYTAPELTMSQRKMDTALRQSTLTAHLQRMKDDKASFDDILISSSKYYGTPRSMITTPDLCANVISRVISDSKNGIPYSTTESPWIKRALTLAYESWRHQFEIMREGAEGIPYVNTVECTDNMHDRCKSDLLLTNISYLVKEFEDVVTQINVIKGELPSDYHDRQKINVLGNHNSAEIKSISLGLSWSYKLAAVKFAEDTYLVPKPYLIMIHNKLCSLLSVLLYAKMSEGNILDVGSYRTVVDFVRAMASVVYKHKNNGFTVLKTLEALAIGETLAETEHWPNSTFLNTIVTELYDSVKFDYYSSPISDIFKNVTTPLRNELATLSKMVGHPYVDMLEGTRVLHQRVTEAVEINLESVRMCGRNAVKNFIKTHVQKRGRWPPVRMLGEVPNRGLVYAMALNRDPDSAEVRQRHGVIPLEAYDDLELLPTMEFAKIENVIPYLKDKTIAMCRDATFLKVLDAEVENADWVCPHNIDKSEPTVTPENFKSKLEEIYDDYNICTMKDFRDPETGLLDHQDWNSYIKSDRYTIMKPLVDSEVKSLRRSMNKRRTSWRDTRLLLTYLCSPEAAHAYSKDIDRCVQAGHWELVKDYLVAKIVPKELELKIKYRGFGCLHPLPRQKNIMQEKNVKKFLEMYNDEQAAALSELSLSRKLYAFRNIRHAYRNYRSLIINLDASGWNTRWRDLTIAPIMEKTLDRIFDYPIFSSTQRMYQQMLYYVEDEMFTAWWDGHEGGVEGQNQETWLYTYGNQIKTALQAFDLPYHLLGKGDDMRIAVLIPPQYLEGTDMETVKNNIVNDISRIMRGFNHTIKSEECYGSEAYFSFGKVASVGTVEIPTAMRKIAQTYGANNAFLPLIDEYVASTLSNAHSAAKVSMNPGHCYIVGLVWMFYYLIQAPDYRDLTDQQLIALTMVPSILGGFPIIFLHNMYVRAESDLLSPYLHILMRMERRSPQVYRAMHYFLRIRKPHKQNMVILLKDPYSIQIDRPQLPLTYFRFMIRRSISRIVKHEMIRKLFRINSRKYTNVITSVLDSCNVIDSRVFASIYACSPEGLIDEICRKFESSRSVEELMIVSSGKKRARRVMIEVMKREQRLHAWRSKRVRGVKPDRSYWVYDTMRTFSCPGEWASHIREYMWGKRVTGVTMPAVSHQVSLTTQTLRSFDPWSRSNHFTYKYTRPVTSLPQCHPICYGTSNLKPFLGHATRTGNIAPTVQFVEKDTVLSKVKTLLDLLSWTNKAGTSPEGVRVESNIDVLITWILKFYTDRTIDEMVPFAAHRKSGTTQHHLRSPEFKVSIVPNMLSNFYQQVQGESNSHVRYTSSRSHYLVNFLHIYCYTVSLLYTPTEYHTRWAPPSVTWAVTNDCDFCNRPIEEEPIVCDQLLIPEDAPKLFVHTKIGSESERIMAESLNILGARGYRREDDVADLDYNVALYGVLQEVVHQGVTLKARMQDRFTQHTMTPGQYNVLRDISTAVEARTVGITELKRLPIVTLLNYVMMYIVHIGMKQLRIFSNRSAFLQITAIPATDLPWYGVIEQIHRAGRLPELISSSKREFESVPTISYDSPESAAAFMGVLSFTMKDRIRNRRLVVKLSYYDEFRFNDTVVPYCYQDRWMEYYNNIREDLDAFPIVEGDDDLEINHPACRLLLLLCMDFTSRDYQDNWRNALGPDLIGDIPTLNYNMEIEDIPVVLDEAWFRQDPFKFWIYRRYDRVSWPLVRMFLTEWIEDIQGNIDATFNPPIVHCEVSTLEACVAVIRERAQDDDEDMERLEIVLPVAEVLDREDLIPARRLPEMRFNKNALAQHGVRVPNTMMNPIGNVAQLGGVFLETNKCYIDPAAMHRVLSNSSQGECKILEVLCDMRMNIPILGRRAIACLGDGTGGFTNALAQITQGSVFLFNTLQVDFRSPNYPHAAMNTIEDRGHTLIKESIEGGINDLSDPTTIDFMIGLQVMFDIVTCDVEYIGEDPGRRSRIIANVCRFVVERCKNISVVVIKFFLSEVDILRILINTARQYFQDSYIVRCRASNVGTEHYYVMVNRTRALWNAETNLFRNLPNPIVQSVNPYINLYLENLHDQYNSIDVGWAYPMQIPRYYRQLREFTTPMILRYITYYFNKVMTPDELIRLMRASRNFTQFSRYDEMSVRALAEEYKQQILHLDEGHLRHQAWTQSTLTHAWRLTEKYFMCRGFSYGCEIFSDDAAVIRVNMEVVRNKFITDLAWMPFRLTGGQVRTTIFDRSVIVNRVVVRPFDFYTRGIYYALLLKYTYLSYT